MGNVYAALVQHAGSVHAACNPHNPHAPGLSFLPYCEPVSVTDLGSVIQESGDPWDAGESPTV